MKSCELAGVSLCCRLMVVALGSLLVACGDAKLQGSANQAAKSDAEPENGAEPVQSTSQGDCMASAASTCELEVPDDSSVDTDSTVGTEPPAESPVIEAAEGKVTCAFVTEAEERVGKDAWDPYVHAPAGYLYGRDDPEGLKDDQEGAENNVVLAAAESLAVGASLKSGYLLSGFELFNDTGNVNHFGKAWAVEVSDDGKTWKAVEDRMEGKHYLNKYVFAKPIASPHFRIRLLELEGPGWDVYFLRLYGKRGDCVPVP